MLKQGVSETLDFDSTTLLRLNIGQVTKKTQLDGNVPLCSPPRSFRIRLWIFITYFRAEKQKIWAKKFRPYFFQNFDFPNILCLVVLNEISKQKCLIENLCFYVTFWLSFYLIRKVSVELDLTSQVQIPLQYLRNRCDKTTRLLISFNLTESGGHWCQVTLLQAY